MQPEISVIMPVYNIEKYLPEAIESILNQTFENFELIILDDKSEDDTLSVAKKGKSKVSAEISVLKMLSATTLCSWTVMTLRKTLSLKKCMKPSQERVLILLCANFKHWTITTAKSLILTLSGRSTFLPR